ncbi:hypothetical protein GGR50DRAFT_698387 [Xylaria sp. CBS 124048]|nr:hypothetical protein GGR50DRAFT_698387 [Xylaria sp. CBS 124048]
MAESREDYSSSLPTSHVENDLFYRYEPTADENQTQHEQLDSLAAFLLSNPTPSFETQPQLSPSAFLDESYNMPGEQAYAPQPELNTPDIDLDRIRMPPPPLPLPQPRRPTAFPIVNMAMTVNGAFRKDSLLHKWILNPHRAYVDPVDATQTRLVTSVCEILTDKNAGSEFMWGAVPHNKSYFRANISLWVGAPDARDNWPKLEVQGGWKQEYNKDLVNHVANPRVLIAEHIGDPRVCRACNHFHAIPRLRGEIAGLNERIRMLEKEVKKERERVEFLQAELEGGREREREMERERPAKRRRKEPAGSEESGQVAIGRGGPLRGRGSRGARGSRARARGGSRGTMARSGPQMTMSTEADHEPSNASFMTSAPYPEIPDQRSTGGIVHPQDLHAEDISQWDYTQ